MKNRSMLAVLLLPIITFGIYPLFWFASTKREMNRLGTDIPTAWLVIIPLINFWWMWKWSEGVEHVTNGKMSGPVAFLLMLVIPWPGLAVVQDSFHKHALTAPSSEPQLPNARIAS